MTDQPTRGEFDMLRQMVGTTQTRLETIDGTGTKGVAVVQAQLVDVVKDLADLKGEVNSRFAEVGLRFDGMKADVDGQFTAHRRVHEQEARDRITGRRWLVGIGLAGLASMSAVITLLVDVLGHLHH